MCINMSAITSTVGVRSDRRYGIRSMTVHRASCLAVLNTDLEKVDYANDGADSLEKLYVSPHDHGATFFHQATKSDPTEPTYTDRLGLTGHLTRKSAKLRFLSGLVDETCVLHKWKIILFCDWPTTSWLVEILMLLLGFSVATIRAKHKWNEREQVVRDFNDRVSTVQVLVTSVKISSTSINLQKDCCRVCFVDVPSNAQSVQRAGGRVVRIGQRSACVIYIFTVDHTYDQHIQASATGS